MLEYQVSLEIPPLDSAIGTVPADKLRFFAAVMALVLQKVVLVAVTSVALGALELPLVRSGGKHAVRRACGSDRVE